MRACIYTKCVSWLCIIWHVVVHVIIQIDLEIREYSWVRPSLSCFLLPSRRYLLILYLTIYVSISTYTYAFMYYVCTDIHSPSNPIAWPRVYVCVYTVCEHLRNYDVHEYIPTNLMSRKRENTLLFGGICINRRI